MGHSIQRSRSWPSAGPLPGLPSRRRRAGSRPTLNMLEDEGFGGDGHKKELKFLTSKTREKAVDAAGEGTSHPGKLTY